MFENWSLLVSVLYVSQLNVFVYLCEILIQIATDMGARETLQQQ